MNHNELKTIVHDIVQKIAVNEGVVFDTNMAAKKLNEIERHCMDAGNALIKEQHAMVLEQLALMVYAIQLIAGEYGVAGSQFSACKKALRDTAKDFMGVPK